MKRWKQLLSVLLIGAALSALFTAGATSETEYEPDDPLGTKYYYYYQLVNDWERDLYWQLKTVNDENLTIHVAPGSDMETEQEFDRAVRRVKQALDYDDPIWHAQWNDHFETEYDEESGRYSVTWEKRYFCTDYTWQKVEARIEQIVNSVDPTADNYTKLRTLLEILASEIVYTVDGQVGGYDADYKSTILGPLSRNAGTCVSHTDTIKLFCDRLGITCVQTGSWDHAWNAVRMENGKWYNVDLSKMKASSDYFDLWISGEWGTNGRVEDAMLSGSNICSEILSEDDFGFVYPTSEENRYVYSGEYHSAYIETESTFVEPEGRFCYKVNEDGRTCAIINYEGIQSGDLIIPETIDGYTVTKIESNAFYNCWGFNGDLIIPDTVTELGVGCFAGCKGLSGQLQLSAKLEIIGGSAFEGCSKLSGSVNFPETLQVIGEYAFRGCAKLTGEFYVPAQTPWRSGVTSMFGTGFDSIRVSPDHPECAAWDDVLYSKDYSEVFLCAPGKTGSLTIHPSAKYIRDIAFNDCTGLTGTLILPDGLISIGAQAFAYTKFSGSLVIPDSVTEIQQSAFYGCENFTDVHIGNGVTEIGGHVFYNCYGLKSVIVGNKVTSIGEGVFCGCENLSTVTLYPSVTTIARGAFALTDLKQVLYHGTREQWEAISVDRQNDCLLQARIYFSGEEPGLDAPTLTVSNNASTGKNVLSWTAVDGAEKYEIWASTSKNGTYSKLGTVTGTSVTHSSAKAGKTYYYKVRAIAGDVKGEVSAAVGKTCDLARPVVTASINASSGKIVLSWSAISGADKYEIYRSSTKDGTRATREDTTPQIHTANHIHVRSTHKHL